MRRALLCVSLAVSAFSLPVLAQDETPTAVTVQNRAGDLPFSTSIGTDIEHVDVSSGDLIVHIPFTSVKGRGLDFNFGLNYDARYWNTGTRQPNGQPLTQVWNIGIGNYVPTGGLGWQPSVGRLTWVNTKVSCSITMPQTMFGRFQSHYIYHDPQGGSHPLAVRYGSASCDSGSFVLTDLQGPDTGTGIYARIPTASFRTPNVYDANGTQVAWSINGGTFVPPPQMLYVGNQYVLGNSEDSNGNTLQSYPGGLDTLGRTIITAQSGTNQFFYKIYDSSGTQQTYTVNYGTISLATHFNATGGYGAIQEYAGSRNAITSIVLPNGRSYLFQYETGSYGAITRIDLPTGAYVTYTWGTIYNTGRGDHAFRYVTSRSLHVDGQTFTWNFSLSCPTTDDTGVVCTNTVTDPLNQQSVYNSTNGSVTTAKIYNGTATGTPVRQYDLTFLHQEDAYGDVEGATSLVTAISTTLDGSLVSRKEFDYNDSASYLWSECDESDPEGSCPTDPNTGLLFQDAGTMLRGNVTEMREFDYGTGGAGPLVRRTKYSYLHNADTNYLTYNIVNKIITATLCNGVVSCAGTGDQSAQTQYEYDNYVAGDNPQQSTTNAAQHDYTIYSSTFKYRGNATRVKRWRNTDGALLTTTYSYDDLGNIRAIKDPLAHTTTFDYTDSFANSFCPPPTGKNGQAYVSTVNNALSQQIKVVRYPCTSLVQSHKDQNDINAGRTGTTYSYDLFGRVTQKSFPDGGQTSATYNDVPPVSSTSSTKITSSSNLVTTAVLDGLGRRKQSQLTSPGCTVSTDTTYDALGRISTTSNPYCTTSDPTYGLTTTLYDALNRVTKVIPQDGTTSANNVTTSYSLNCITATDEAGKARKSCSDGLGRLTQVFEDPGSSPHLNYETDYAYDTLNNLLTVNQKGNDPNSANWRTRTFTYNSLSQLLAAANPESGTIQYSYDNNGNVLTKRDARNITTTYYPDALNRNTAKSYSDGTETLYYTYDTPPGWMSDSTNVVGRLANTSNSSGGSTDGKATAATFSYDAMGRVIRNWQQTPSTSPGGSFVYQSYDLAGDLISSTSAAGVTISYAYDSAARPIAVTSSWSDAQHPATLYAVDPSVGYFPNGAIRKVTLANGLTESAMYNSRLQPCRMEINSTAAYFTQCTGAAPSGNVLDFTYGFNSGVSDNGNVATLSSIGNQTFTRSYVYDSVNRISTLSDTATAQTCKGLSWTIDPWGNRTDQTVTSGTCNTFHSGAALTNNRLGSPYAYDSAGNMTYDGVHHYTYDAENHLIQVDAGATASYIYDPNGNRVRKNSGGSWTEYFYDFSGKVTAEHNSAGWPVEYVYVGSQLVAQYRDATTYSVFRDHLGSTRLITKLDKSIFDSLDFLPYGEQLAGATGTTHKFTGKERDSESNLDNFGARYDSSNLGRFMSPDLSDSPDPVPHAQLGDPQTLNLYAYAENNPLNLVDDDGHDPQQPNYAGKCGNWLACWLRGFFQSGSSEPMAGARGGGFPSAPPPSASTQKPRMTSEQINNYNNGAIPIGPGEAATLLNLLKADGPELTAIIKQLFKATDTLPGGTAGAVREEIKTGVAVGGKWHTIKALERVRQLEKLMSSGRLSANDMKLAQVIVDDLKAALAGK